MINRRILTADVAWIVCCCVALLVTGRATAALLVKHGNTSNVVRLVLKSTLTGQGLTGLTNASSGLVISTITNNEATATAYTVGGSNVETITTLGTYSAPTSGKCRFGEVDATNHPGLYEIQLANARFSVSSARSLVITVSGATNLLSTDYEIQLLEFDPFDGVRGGLTALPNAAAGANGGLATADANNAVKANVTQFGGTNGSFSGGRPEVNLTHAGGTAVGVTGTANFRRFFDGNGYGPLLFSGAVDDVTTQTHFIILTPVGGIEDDSLNGLTIVLRDGPDFSLRTIVSSDRVGSSSSDTVDITIDAAPTFTATEGTTTYEILPASFNPADRTALTAASTRVTTALPDAAPAANGGLPTGDSNNTVKANVTQFGGTNGTFSSGRPAVNTTYLAGSVLTEDEPGVLAGTFSNFFGDYNGVQEVDIRDITNTYIKVDTEVAAIKTKTDFLPSATAGSAGGVFIAGTNEATTITGGLTANITGNLSGSVGSVSGNVGGNVVGSVGSISGVTFPANFSGLTITSGRVNADVTHWLGTGVATPTVGGVPEIDITHVLGTEVCH